MKSLVVCKPVMVLAGMVVCSQIAPVLLAQNAAPASDKAAAPVSTSETFPPRLSPAVSVVLTLARAHVGDDVTIAYIKQSGRAYHLSVSEILYLRKQGVSDHVLATMLTARPSTAAISAQTVPQSASTSTADWVSSSPQAAPAAIQPVSTYAATAAVYSQPVYAQAVYAQPVYVQPSPVYAYPAPRYGYYDYWPSYRSYPVLSVGFGFGFGGGYYGGYRGGGYFGGGYHGGGHYGGGYHGGGYHGGGHR